MSAYKGKTLLITGGTGSFGNVVLNRFFKKRILVRFGFFHVTKKNRMI